MFSSGGGNELCTKNLLPRDVSKGVWRFLGLRWKYKHMKPTESQIQIAYFDWVRIKANQDSRYENIIAIPNQGGSGLNGILRGKKMKAEGLSKGFPDVFCFIQTPEYGGLAIEFKVPDGKQSKEQEKWEKILSLAHYLYLVAYSTDQAIIITESYMKRALFFPYGSINNGINQEKTR